MQESVYVSALTPVVYFFGVVILYLLPWIVAGIRNTKNRSWVAIITILFGWTVLGWFVALVMAAEGEKRA